MWNTHRQTHRVNRGVFWLTSVKGTQRLWRFILFIAAVADPVNQVYCFKGKHNHLGFKNTALLCLGSVLYHPLSPKLSVQKMLCVASSFQKSVLFWKYWLAKCQTLVLEQAWCRLEICTWHRNDCCLLCISDYETITSVYETCTNGYKFSPFKICEILLDLHYKFSSI